MMALLRSFCCLGILACVWPLVVINVPADYAGVEPGAAAVNVNLVVVVVVGVLPVRILWLRNRFDACRVHLRVLVHITLHPSADGVQSCFAESWGLLLRNRLSLSGLS